MTDDEKNIIGTPKRREGDVPDAYTWTIHTERPGLGATSPALEYDDGSGVVAHEWPEAECSVDTIRERWGEGTYRVRWWGRDAAGVRSQRGNGRMLTLAPIAPPPRAAAPAAPAASTTLDPMRMVEMMMGARQAAQQETMQSLGALAQLMGSIGGARPAAADTLAEERFSVFRREVVLAVQQQFDALTKSVEALQRAQTDKIAALERELADMRAELEEWEDADDEGDDEDEPAAPPRERPDTAGAIVKEHALTGLDTALQAMGPAVMPAVVGFVEAKKREAEARAKAAEEAARPPTPAAPLPAAAAAAE